MAASPSGVLYLLGLITAGKDAIGSSKEEMLSEGISSAGASFKSNEMQVLLAVWFHPVGVAAVKEAKVDRCKTEQMKLGLMMQ